jgi:hypothetical protein
VCELGQVEEGRVGVGVDGKGKRAKGQKGKRERDCATQRKTGVNLPAVAHVGVQVNGDELDWLVQFLRS